MSVFFKRRGPAPVLGKLLSDYAHGDIVKLNENGVPIEFYVAKHDYESGLNGAGRTLLVRKELLGTNYTWINSYISDETTGTMTYEDSLIDSWINNTYMGRFDQEIKTLIGSTTFKHTSVYCKWNWTAYQYTATVKTMSRAAFVLSPAEFGFTATQDGDVLPISEQIKIAYFNGTAGTHWTRTPVLDLVNNMYYIGANGTLWSQAGGGGADIQVCFTFPGSTIFDPDTNEFLKAS